MGEALRIGLLPLSARNLVLFKAESLVAMGMMILAIHAMDK